MNFHDIFRLEISSIHVKFNNFWESGFFTKGIFLRDWQAVSYTVNIYCGIEIGGKRLNF